MELVLVLSTFTCLIFAISVAIDKATKFITALKDSGSAKMKNGFKASLSIVPIDKKSEECATNTTSTNETFE